MNASPEQASEAVAALLAALTAQLAPVPAAQRIVAVSGGRDSVALMHALVLLHEREGSPAPRAVHVHHGLHADADLWAEFVQARCAALGAACEVLGVAVQERGEGMEAAARRARYRALTGVLAPGEVLLLAHHQDDQVETVFMRMMRGAGPRGLAGMPGQRRLGVGSLLRPWLEVSGAQIEAAARDWGLSWLEDPSNTDPGVDRVHVRRHLLPMLEARWPGARAALLRSASACAEVETLLEELQPQLPPAGAPLPIADLGATGASKRLRIRSWLSAAGLAMPSRARLDELVRQSTAAEDAHPEIVLGEHAVRRHAGALHLVPVLREAPVPTRIPAAPGRHRLAGGILSLTAARRGLRCDLPAFDVRYRAGGERLRLPGRGGVTLKQVLQEAGVPAWARDRVPLLMAGEQVLAVAGVGVCEPGIAAPGAAALMLEWCPEGGVAEPPLSDDDVTRVE